MFLFIINNPVSWLCDYLLYYNIENKWLIDPLIAKPLVVYTKLLFHFEHTQIIVKQITLLYLCTQMLKANDIVIARVPAIYVLSQIFNDSRVIWFFDQTCSLLGEFFYYSLTCYITREAQRVNILIWYCAEVISLRIIMSETEFWRYPRFKGKNHNLKKNGATHFNAGSTYKPSIF